jgi:hypothetical protein
MHQRDGLHDHAPLDLFAGGGDEACQAAVGDILFKEMG